MTKEHHSAEDRELARYATATLFWFVLVNIVVAGIVWFAVSRPILDRIERLEGEIIRRESDLK
ncbi:MAG: hypothetical protein SFX74_03465 [Fimbriimonadaceae bacterium]|nr:hypothetical protein [Fimbriimonadaceae bacterium]